MAMLVKKKKTLCLTNVVSYKLDVHQEGAFDNISLVVNRMLDFINVHGTINIGPVIQYNNYVCTENGNSEMNVELLIQCKDYIRNVDRPYEISPKIKVNDCYMCHYVGNFFFSFITHQYHSLYCIDGNTLKKYVAICINFIF